MQFVGRADETAFLAMKADEGTAPSKARAIWRSFPIFGLLDDEVLTELSRRAKRRSWSAGELIFEKGDKGEYFMALTDGRVKLTILSQAGRELLIKLSEPGDLVGEIACLDGGPRSSTATAATKATAWVMSRNDYRDLAARFPALHEAAIAHLAGLLRDTNDRLESISLYQLHARLARFILFSLHHLNGTDLDQVAILTLPLNQTELGLLVGATRSKVNRVLQDFREEGVLIQDGPTWHCDVAALRKIADE